MTARLRVPAFEHPALFYGSDEAYLDALVPFIVEGLEQSQPVCVAAPGPKLGLLREALGSSADGVQLIDMTSVGRNPGRIIAGVLSAFANTHRDERVRIVGEPIWPGRTEAEYPACVQHEALINTAFAQRDLVILCPYDVARLDRRTLEDARATHPVVWEGDRTSVSRQYDPAEVLERYNQPLPILGGAEFFSVTGPEELSGLRRHAANQGAAIGISGDLLTDLIYSATELATNSLLHGGGSCEVRIDRVGEYAILDVRDGGHMADPMAGRRPPPPGQLSGRGLLVVHEFADLVRTHTGTTGTVIQAYFGLGRS